jgi:hypothetical protein
MTGLRKTVMTLFDITKTIELLILEAYSNPARDGVKMQEALVYRAGDYPVPAYRILPQASHHSQSTAMVLVTHELTMLREPIREVPDRLGQDWAERRFAFGGRLFVRKPFKKASIRLPPEAVFEYTNATPVEGSKTGKRNDDAFPTKLWWRDPAFHIGLHHKYHAAGGLDPLFKEYIIATEMMKFELVLTGASPPTQAEGTRAQEEQLGMALMAAKIVFSVILALAGGTG